MKYEDFYTKFEKILHALLPDTKELVNFISDTLHMEKRTAYRRMSGDCQFRVDEVLNLCSHLDISLDRFIAKNSPGYSSPVYFYHPFDNLTEREYNNVYKWLGALKAASKEKGSYIFISSNILPLIFCFQYENLIRLAKLKWGYYTDRNLIFKKFMETKNVFEPEHWRAVKEYISTIFRFEKLLIVWDKILYRLY